MMEPIQDIISQCGLSVQRFERVSGGDINDAYCVYTKTGRYFLKLNDKDHYPAMFEKEARGLELLNKHSSLRVPSVISSGQGAGRQYLLLEWLEKGPPQRNMWEQFGAALAMMHKQPQEYFGLNEDNYIGSLKQVNDRHNDWPAFYSQCRIMPLVRILHDQGVYSKKDVAGAETFCHQISNIFPQEPAALLHGDLWAGNYLIHSAGYAAIYDPAVYFGHREMDIGMTRLFGGFDQRFYAAYDAIYPLEKDWGQRLPLTQLYPLLVHAVLFGGHYVSTTIHMLAAFRQ